MTPSLPAQAARPVRVLVALDDSPAALAALEVAVALATPIGAGLCLVHVLQDGELVRALAAMGREAGVAERREADADSLLQRGADLARRHGLDVDTLAVDGEPARCILQQASDWAADVVVVGRSDVRGPGQPYVGSVTRHVLEFSPRPVLVVPRPEGARSGLVADP